MVNTTNIHTFIIIRKESTIYIYIYIYTHTHTHTYINIPQFLHQDPNTELHSTPDTLTVQNNANILVAESYKIIYSTGNTRI